MTDIDNKEKTRKLVDIAVNALKDKKGCDIRLLDISEISSCTDYFIIVAGSNKKHIQTLADEVEEKLKKTEKTPAGIEGYSGASWILLDYQEFVVHIFSIEDRHFYDIEHLWRDGKELDIT